jgi:hypothetical protein
MGLKSVFLSARPIVLSLARSVSQNLAILWLLSWLRPLWLNPRKGQREAQRQIRRFA